VFRLAIIASFVLLVGACRASQPTPSTTLPPEEVRPLAGLASVPVVLTPAHAVRSGDALGWAGRINSREFLRSLDAEIAFVLRERGIDTVWRLPERLLADVRRNPTLGVNPQSLAADQLRSPVLKLGQKIGEPLASQLRNLVALHDGRLILVPVEIRFVPEAPAATSPPAAGRAVLRLVLVDARVAEVKWIGEVRSDVATSPSKSVEATLGLRVGDLVVQP
jgi:hypothetical protein